MGSLYLLKVVLGLSDLAAVAISFWIGFVVAFVLQKWVTFKNHDKQPKVIGKQLIMYGALAAWNYVFTLGLVALFSHAMSVFLIRTVAIAIITLWNYVIYRKLIFKEILKAKKKKKAKKPNKKPVTRMQKILQHFVSFKSPYVIFSTSILIITTLWWSILGAVLQSTNADQIINSYLFENTQTFNSALIPSAHTFLIKWPLFIIERLSGHSALALVTLTVLVSVATVVGLAYLLYRIDRRPKVFGTAMLALAGVLLFIPAQPYAGGLLPVNFAMLATRNIEYLFYILSLVLIIRAPRFRNLQFVSGIVLMSLLVTSDQLFMWLSLGGAGIMTVVYIFARRLPLVKLGIRWLATTILAVIISTIIVWVINLAGLTHIVGGSGPYGFIQNIKEFGLGCVFAVMGLLTNFGANPIFDIGVIKDMPGVLVRRLFSPITIPFIVNLGLFIIGLVASVRLFRASLIPPKQVKRRKKQPEFTTTGALAVALIASTITSIGFFIVTNHYYPVDSRYETISLFALSVAIMAYVRTRSSPVLRIPRVVGVLVIGIIIGLIWTFNTYQQQSSALTTINARNTKIADVLQNHKSDLLVGDYWRVVPISQINKNIVNHILPLGDCTTPRASLTSKSWEQNFENKSFIYLLSLDKGLTDYPSCSIDQIIQTYGHPNGSTVIAGTNDNPTELLLFYDGGVNNNHNITSSTKISTILPTTTQQVKPIADCTNDMTIMNVIAHQDDDLLFMNPDIQHAIDAGDCVRTVYVTAGDAGQSSQYWLGRERASEAAYESMLGVSQPLVWTQRTLKVRDHEFVTVVNPKGNRQISLIFMRLPDGNLNGQGFNGSGHESLAHLLSGKVPSMLAVDGQSFYSSGDLTQVLTDLMNLYNPTTVNTQAASNVGHLYQDHSDHTSVGTYVDMAFEGYVGRNNASLQHYIGYPIRERPENVTDRDLDRKIDAFLAYAGFDGGVCQTLTMCDKTATYGAYLRREYAQ